MASQGPYSPSTATSSGTGTVWSTPTGVTGSGGSAATTTGTTSDTSATLIVRGFNSLNIPSTANIDGILFEINWSKTGSANSLPKGSLSLTKNGTSSVGTANNFNALPTSPAYQSFGGSTSLWGTTWTPSQINSSNFGILITIDFQGTSGASSTASIDHVRVTVYYSDDTSPTISSGPTVSGQPLTSKSYSVVFTATDDISTGANALSYTIRTGSGATGGSQLKASTSFTSGSSVNSGTLSDTSLAQGSNTRYLRVTDEAGNTREQSFTVLYDVLAPTVSAGPTVSANPVDASKQYTVTFTPSDTVSTSANALSYAILDNTKTSTLTSSTATSDSSNTTATINDTGLAQGSNTRYLRLTDEAGNSADYSFSVTYDGVAPTVSAGPTPSASVVGTSKHYGVTFTAVDTVSTGLNAITYQIRTAASGGGSMLVSGPATSGNPVSVSSGFITDSSLVQGLNTRYLRLTDEAGNAADYPFTITYDGAAPTITVAPTHSPNPVTTSKQYTVTFTATDTVATGANALTYTICTASGGGGALITDTATSGVSKTTGLIFDSGLIHGSGNVRYLRVTDEVGNTVEYSFTVTAQFTQQYTETGGLQLAKAVMSGFDAKAAIDKLGQITLLSTMGGGDWIRYNERFGQSIGKFVFSGTDRLQMVDLGPAVLALVILSGDDAVNGTKTYTDLTGISLVKAIVSGADGLRFTETLSQIIAKAVLSGVDHKQGIETSGAIVVHALLNGSDALTMPELAGQVVVLVNTSATIDRGSFKDLTGIVLPLAQMSGIEYLHYNEALSQTLIKAVVTGLDHFGWIETAGEIVTRAVISGAEAAAMRELTGEVVAVVITNATVGGGNVFELTGTVVVLSEVEGTDFLIIGQPVRYQLIHFALDNPYSATVTLRKGETSDVSERYQIVGLTSENVYTATIALRR